MKTGTKIKTVKKILVVDDEKTTQKILKKVLENYGYEVSTSPNGKDALKKIKEIKFDVLLTDLNMPHINGIELTKKVLKIEPGIIVILITAYGTIRSAVEAIKLGAYDYLTKPIDNKELLLSISSGINKTLILKENILLKKQLDKTKTEFEFLSENEKIKSILDEANAVAKSNSAVLIFGEKGTGKEHLARYIHNKSSRSVNQFINVDCASIPKEMIEVELFGEISTQSKNNSNVRMGYFESAENGTIFLSEISSLDSLMQLKILKVIEDKQFSRIGDNKILNTSARIIASTSENLEKLVFEGKFNQNLFYKINVFEFDLPALKDRPEDILLYFLNFVKFFANANSKNIKDLTPDVKKIIINYSWPGNVLELRNVAERAAILCEEEYIQKEHLPLKICEVDSVRELIVSKDFNENKRAMVREFETNYIKRFLRIHKGNVTAVSRDINFHPVTLRQKIAKLGIDPKEFKITKTFNNLNEK